MPKFRFLFCIVLLVGTLGTATAHTYEQILEMVVQSPTFKAATATAEAQQLSARTGRYLADPQVEVGYQWGDPVPSRTLVNVSQELDWSVLSGNKKRISEQKQWQAEEELGYQRWQLVKEVKQMLARLATYNLRLAQLQQRADLAHSQQQAYERAVEKGEMNRLHLNAASLEYLMQERNRVAVQAEKDELLLRLSALCGQEVEYADTVLQSNPLPLDFETWYNEKMASEPQLILAKRQYESAQERLQSEKLSYAPPVTLKYAGEIAYMNNYHGFLVGLNLPLWNNAGRIKASKMEVKAADLKQEKEQNRLYMQYKQAYIKAQYWQDYAEEFQQTLQECSNIALLQRALQSGQISYMEYLQGLKFQYDMQDALAAIRLTALLYALELEW